MGEKSTNIYVLVPDSFEGNMAELYFRRIVSQDKCNLHVERKSASFRFRDLMNRKYDGMVFVVGLPYKGEDLGEAFYNKFDLPFTDFIHVSTFGKKLGGNNIKSIVKAGVDPCAVVHYLFGNDYHLTNQYIDLKNAENEIKAVNAYRKWTWEINKNDLTTKYWSLYNGLQSNFAVEASSMSEGALFEKYNLLIEGQCTKLFQEQATQIDKMHVQVRKINGKSTMIGIGYAPNHDKELASLLLSQMEMEGGNDIQQYALMFVKPTSGNDRITVHTKGLSAKALASSLHRSGQGTDDVASLFTESSSLADLYTRLFQKETSTA